MRALPRPDAERAEALLLVAAPAALLAASSIRSPLLLVWAVLWLAVFRPPRRERWLAGTAFAIAIALTAIDAAPLVVPSWSGKGAAPASVREAYRAAWTPLVQQASVAASLLGEPSDDAEFVRHSFDRLDALARVSNGTLHLRLVDPDGVTRAWAGAGLVPEPVSSRLPERGATVEASFSSVAFLVAEPVPSRRRSGEVPGTAGRAWQVVAGRSFALDPPGFLPAARLGEPSWRVRFPRSDERLDADWTLDEPGLPRLAVAVDRTGSGADRATVRTKRSPVAAWAMALGLLAIAVLRGIGRLLLRGTILAGARSGWVSAAAASSALGCWAVGVPVSAKLVLAVLGGAVLLVAATRVPKGRWGPWAADLLAMAAAASALLVSWLLALSFDAGDSSPGWLSSVAVLRGLPPALIVASGLLAAGRLAASGARGVRWGGALVGLALLLLAASAIDSLPVAVLALIVAAATWRRAVADGSHGGGAGLAALALLASSFAAVAVEIAERGELRRSLPQRLWSIAPPTAERLTPLAASIEAHFAGLEAATFAPREIDEVDRLDLAYALWRRSPLARPDALSALTVQLPGARSSVFAFGLPLTPEGELDREPARWSEVAVPGWESALVAGEAWIELRGERWALARFWMLPRPGFTAQPPPLDDLAGILLRGGPAVAGGRLVGTRPEVRLALFSPEGRALLTPWREEPPQLRLAPGESTSRIELATPDGPAWGIAQREGWGVLALLVQRLSWIAGIERVATRALGFAVWGLGLLGAAALLSLPRSVARDFALRAVRSYSRRLLLLFGGMVLVPSVVLYTFLTAALGRRLELQKRQDGEAALNSAQRVLGEYLATLDPGFGLDTALDDALLGWLSRVVQHDVNLYWGGQLYASSRRELFTSGLLPHRIPGEVQARLALFGDDLASRDSQAGSETYLELFAPLRVPGVPIDRGRLFLSMPLLAQQEELGAELERLRRRALLVASGLFAGLSIVGIRLARNFTQPLDELVESTRRIAAGEPARTPQPRELELAALVEAIDRMAGRIAEGRERLVREKLVVERIVENVTSGVVSIDEAGRVQLANRAARTLLGVAPGEVLVPAIAAQPALAPLAAHLKEAGRELEQWTVRLAGKAGEDREWAVVWAPVPGEGEMVTLLIVEDATEVLRGQRLAAWAEMARIIAHEIKNPLTPIRLSTEFLREVWQRDRERFPEAFARCTANILRQVDELRDIAGDFATYSRLPRLERRPGDLVALVGELVEGYAGSVASVAEVRLEAPPTLACRFDSRLLGRAVRNLIENSLRVSAAGQRVVVTLSATAEEARIAVEDHGPGVPEDLLSRIFEPYFSTQSGGTGLGLPIARRIAVEHGGTLVAHNRPGGGLAAIITIPLS